MDVTDKLEIHELLGLYGHIIDAEEWDRMDELFTEDLVFDASSFGGEPHHGIPALRKEWETTSMHPLAHHATNIVVSQDEDGTVRVLSKGIGVGRKGRVGSVTYRDIVRKDGGRWKIARRVAEWRQP